jgi:CheY-like chemotaxis protein
MNTVTLTAPTLSTQDIKAGELASELAMRLMGLAKGASALMLETAQSWVKTLDKAHLITAHGLAVMRITEAHKGSEAAQRRVTSTMLGQLKTVLTAVEDGRANADKVERAKNWSTLLTFCTPKRESDDVEPLDAIADRLVTLCLFAIKNEMGLSDLEDELTSAWDIAQAEMARKAASKKDKDDE